MHRSPVARIVSAFFALWFAVFTAEPAGLHTCPVHDGPGAGLHAGHGQAVGGGTHSDHSATSHSGGTHRSAPDQAGARICQCPGSCCTATPIIVPALAEVAVPTVIATADPGLPDHAYVALSRTLLLPFANGPPLTRV